MRHSPAASCGPKQTVLRIFRWEFLDVRSRSGDPSLTPKSLRPARVGGSTISRGRPHPASGREGSAASSISAGPAAKARRSRRYRQRFLQPVKPTDTEQRDDHRLSLRHLFRTLLAHTDAVPSRSQNSGYSTCLRPPVIGQMVHDSSAPVAQLLGAIDSPPIIVTQYLHQCASMYNCKLDPATMWKVKYEDRG